MGDLAGIGDPGGEIFGIGHQRQNVVGMAERLQLEQGHAGRIEPAQAALPRHPQIPAAVDRDQTGLAAGVRGHHPPLGRKGDHTALQGHEQIAGLAVDRDVLGVRFILATQRECHP